jgi:hypothetical protein
MAASVIKQVSYTDDMSGEKLNSSDRVQIRVTDGTAVWYIDTARKSDLVTLLKTKGAKQAKRGRKAK